MSFILEKNILWPTPINAGDKFRRNTCLPLSIGIIISVSTETSLFQCYDDLYMHACSESLRFLWIKYLFRWKTTGLFITLNKNVCNWLEY